MVFQPAEAPLKLIRGKELSTGNGVYSVSAGSSFSRQVDPVVVFASLSFGYSFPARGLNYKVNDTDTIEKVELGESYSGSAGIAYALSYKVSVNSSMRYTLQRGNKYYFENVTNPRKTGDSVSATFSIGVGWKTNEKTTYSVSLGYGLTGSSFSLSFRIPYTFVL